MIQPRPGFPNYDGPQSGLFTLLHHEGPAVEWSDNVMERVEYIQIHKPEAEHKTRFRHIVYVDPELLPPSLTRTYNVLVKEGVKIADD